MVYNLSSLVSRCETMEISSLNAGSLTHDKLRKLWRAVCSFATKQLSQNRAANVPQFGRFSKSPDGHPRFVVADTFVRQHGLRATKPVVQNLRSADVSWAGLAMAAGVNKDAARVGLRELIGKMGEYGARDAVSVTMPGLGHMHISNREVTFNGQGGGGGGRARGRAVMAHSRSYSGGFGAGGGHSGVPAISARRMAPPPQRAAPAPAPARALAPAAAVRGPSSPIAAAGARALQSRSAQQLGSSRYSQAKRSARGPAMNGSGTMERTAHGHRAISHQEMTAYNDQMLATKKVQSAQQFDKVLAEDQHMLDSVQMELLAEKKRRERQMREKRKAAMALRKQAEDDAARRRAQKRAEHMAAADTTWHFTDNEAVQQEEQRRKQELRKTLDAQVADARVVKQRMDRANAKTMTYTQGRDAGAGNPYPVFWPGLRQAARGRFVPPDAAEAAYRDAYDRTQKELAQSRAAIAKKDREIKDSLKAFDKEYMRRKAKRHQAQQDMNHTLATQVDSKKQTRQLQLTKLYTEPPPDHSGVHPEEPTRDYAVEDAAKTYLRKALDEQLKQQERSRRKARRNNIRQDRFFLDGVARQMRADRAERERRKRETQQELHTEWQRQANLTSLKKATAL